jgi:SAM-dependent methyltransferase
VVQLLKEIESIDHTSIDHLADEIVEAFGHMPGLAGGRLLEGALLRRTIPFDTPILDLGCGEGRFADVLLRPIRPDVGLDLDAGLLSRASHLGAHKQLVLADASKAVLPEEYFGTVFSNCVFEHIKDLELVIAQAFRWLKPGGRLVATAQCTIAPRYFYLGTLLEQLSMDEMAKMLVKRYLSRNQVQSHWSPDRYLKELGSIGFVDIELTEYGSLTFTRRFNLLDWVSRPLPAPVPPLGIILLYVAAHIRKVKPRLAAFEKALYKRLVEREVELILSGQEAGFSCVSIVARKPSRKAD